MSESSSETGRWRTRTGLILAVSRRASIRARLSRKEAAARLRTLLHAGIGCFIDLTQREEGLAPYAGIAAREASRLDTTFVHARRSSDRVDRGQRGSDDQRGWPRSVQQTAGILDAIARRWMTAGTSTCTVGAASAGPAPWSAAGSCATA